MKLNWQTGTNAAQDLDDTKQKRQEIIATNQQLKQEMKLIKERLGKLESVSGAECPLCGQKVNQSEQKRLIASLSLQGTNFGDQYRENQRQVQDFDEQIKELDSLLLGLRKAEEEARRLSQDEACVNTRLESLQNTLSRMGNRQRAAPGRNCRHPVEGRLCASGACQTIRN